MAMAASSAKKKQSLQSCWGKKGFFFPDYRFTSVENGTENGFDGSTNEEELFYSGATLPLYTQNVSNATIFAKRQENMKNESKIIQ